MSQLVVGSDQVVHRHLGALLDAEIPAVAKIPGRSMADHVSIERPFEHRGSPERVRNRFHAQRHKELIRQLENSDGIVALSLETQRHVDALFRRERDGGIVQIAPALRPHVAQQVSRNRPIQRHQFASVHSVELPANVGVQLLIKWRAYE